MTSTAVPRKVSWSGWLLWQTALALGRLPFRWKVMLARRMGRGFLTRPSPWLEFAWINLSLCFPSLSGERQVALLESVAFESALSSFNRLRAWSISKQGLRRMVHIEHLERLQQARLRGPVILLCPHFVGLELVGLRLNLETPLTVLYGPGANADVEALKMRARLRFGQADLVARGAPLRAAVSKLADGQPLLLAPDLDLGARGAVFAPFFGMQAATTKTTAWAAARFAASVLPVSIRRVDRDRHLITIHDPVRGLTGDVIDDTGRINAVIESLVAAEPEQYWWDHPRFVTQPAGKASPYSEEATDFALDQFIACKGTADR